ncbi:hypothetical protein ACQP2Y_26535 [Actinoplanes sp. CA-051413]|uniref:hypothetical protein n=1 Tax=Actinoplanes sp. CA-051413 TaxID=3239899 RepID=UPI003D95862F
MELFAESGRPGSGRPAKKPCARCGHPTRVDRMIHGFGEDCALKLGLIVAVPRLRTDEQTGTDLLDLLAEEPEDCCDGWDR